MNYNRPSVSYPWAVRDPLISLTVWSKQYDIHAHFLELPEIRPFISWDINYYGFNGYQT